MHGEPNGRPSGGRGSRSARGYEPTSPSATLGNPGALLGAGDAGTRAWTAALGRDRGPGPRGEGPFASRDGCVIFGRDTARAGAALSCRSAPTAPAAEAELEDLHSLAGAFAVDLQPAGEALPSRGSGP